MSEELKRANAEAMKEVGRQHTARRSREEVILKALILLEDGNDIAAKTLLRNRARDWGLIGE